MRVYMHHRQTHTQAVAAAKAGFSERSARRIDRDPRLPSQKLAGGPARATPSGPLDAVWTLDVLPLLEAMPSLRPITILEELERRLPIATGCATAGHWSGGSGAGGHCMGPSGRLSFARPIRP